METSSRGHVRELSDSFRARGDNLPIARAVENTTTVIVADIAGHQADRMSYGFSPLSIRMAPCSDVISDDDPRQLDTVANAG